MEIPTTVTRNLRPPASLPCYSFVSLILFGYVGSTHQAIADELSVNDSSIIRLAQSTLTLTDIPPAPGPAPSRFAAIDQLKLRGWNVPLPNAANTVDQGLFGVRQSLADAGISYVGIVSTFYADNLLRHGGPPGGMRENQQYLGQRPTYVSQDALYMMYDLRRYGIPDGQITVGTELNTTNWNPAAPNKLALATATYYQTLFDKRVELKVGYLANSLEFLGTFVGGSLAGGVFGPSAAVFTEQGENSGSFSTPGVNIRINFPNNIYTKVGIQRAISPDGAVIETNQNRSAVRFKVPNSGVFAIDETGYKVDAAPGQMQTWIRAAGSYTSSRYIEQGSVTGQRAPNSYGLFFLADRQLLQTAPNGEPGSAVQGVYAGVSAEYAPPQLNRFSQYYEARLYGFGLIRGRPFDLASLVFTENVFSTDAVRLAQSRHLHTHADTQALTVSYSAHVLPGININAGFGYTSNPTSVSYTTSTGSALNLLIGTVMFF